MPSSGSRAGRREGSALISEMERSWEEYQRLSTEYEELSAERSRLYERADAETVPLERARLFESAHAVEQRLAENINARRELFTFMEENAEGALRAARAMRGEGRASAVQRMEELQMEITSIRRDMEREQRDAERTAARLRQMVAQLQRTAEAEAQPQALPVSGITAEYSSDYNTVMGWWRRFTALEHENDELNRKCQRYRQREGEAQSEGNARREDYYIRKSEELERRIDANIAEQLQLMANIIFSLSDALYAVQGEDSRRRSQELLRIYDSWAAHQAKMLEQIDIRGAGPGTNTLYASANYLCTHTMEDIYAQMRGVERAYIIYPAAQQRVSPETVPAPVPPQTAVVPTPAAPAEAAPQAAAAPAVAPSPETFSGDRARWALNLYADIHARLGRLGEVSAADREQYIALLARDYLTLKEETRAIRDAVERDFRESGVGEQLVSEMNRLLDSGPRLGERIAAATGMTARELNALADSRFPAGAAAAPVAEAAVPEAPAAAPAAPVAAAAGGPVQVPEGATYFEYRNARTGRAYRISIDGEDLSRLSMEEVYARVQEYAGNAAKFRHLHVERVDGRGNVDYTYRSRQHVRDRFFQEQLGWVPGAAAAAPEERPAAPAEAQQLADFSGLDIQAELSQNNPYLRLQERAYHTPVDPAVYAAAIADFNKNNPEAGIRFSRFGGAYELGMSHFSQAPAYVYEALSRLMRYRYRGGENGENRESYFDFVSRQANGENGGREGGVVMAGEIPLLDQKYLAVWGAGLFTFDAGAPVQPVRDGNGNITYDSSGNPVMQNVVFANIAAARRGEANAEDRNQIGNTRYCAMVYPNLAQYYSNPSLFMEKFEQLTPEMQASILFAAAILGRVIYSERVRARGGDPTAPPATEEEKRELKACENSAVMLLMLKAVGEAGSASFGKFTWGETEYDVGSHMLTRAGFERLSFSDHVPPDSPLAAARTHTLIFLPTEAPNKVMIVGGIVNGQAFYLEPGQEFEYTLDDKDSIGMFGLTRHWTNELPIFQYGGGAGVMMEIGTPDFKPVEPPFVPPLARISVPPERASMGGKFYLTAEYYNEGELIDEASFHIKDPQLDGQPISFEQLFAYNAVWIDFNNFRRVKGQDHYYATVSPEVAREHADMFESPKDVENVAEFVGGKIYIYVNEQGKIVDAYKESGRAGVRRLPPEGEEWTYSFTLVKDKNEKEIIKSAEFNIPDEYRSLILTRVRAQELLRRLQEGDRLSYDSGTNSVEIELTSRAYALGRFHNLPGEPAEDILSYVWFNNGPIFRGPAPEAEVSVIPQEFYDREGFMVPRYERTVAIDSRLREIRETFYGQVIGPQEWDSISSEVRSLYEERMRLCQEMISYTQSALSRMESSGTPVAPVAREILERQIGALQINMNDMEEKWAVWQAGSADIERQLAPYR